MKLFFARRHFESSLKGGRDEQRNGRQFEMRDTTTEKMKSADVSNSRNVLFADGQTFGLRVKMKLE